MTLKMSASSSEPRPRRDGFSSGADYVKSLYDPARAEGIDAPFRDAVENVLRPLTSSMIWIHRDNSSIELAVLARRDCVDLVRQAGEALHAEFPRIPFRLSGPWPLEAFAAADRE